MSFSEKSDNKAGIARNLGNIGNVYQLKHDYHRALEYYFKAMKINEDLGKKTGIATNLVNIGRVYELLSDYEKRLFFFINH